MWCAGFHCWRVYSTFDSWWNEVEDWREYQPSWTSVIPSLRVQTRPRSDDDHMPLTFVYVLVNIWSKYGYLFTRVSLERNWIDHMEQAGWTRHSWARNQSEREYVSYSKGMCRLYCWICNVFRGHVFGLYVIYILQFEATIIIYWLWVNFRWV